MTLFHTIVFLLIFFSTLTSAVPFESRLLADKNDVNIEFGLVLNYANTLERDDEFKCPPGNYVAGTMVLGMFHSLENPGTYEIYASNSTGNIPIEKYGSFGSDPGMCLYRWITSDFKNYHGGDCTLWVASDGLGDFKSITRDDDLGIYYMIYWGPPAPDANGGSPYLYTSKDNGNTWNGPQLTKGLDHYNPPGTTIHAKDDINLLHQPGVGLVDLQLFWEKNASIPGGYCDNGGCDKRRVLGTMKSEMSSGGIQWNFNGSTRIPGADENDPPELQFYRSRPFFVPSTNRTRIFAHTLLYAPSPYINLKYGRQPIGGGGSCRDPPNEKQCHGPHMYEEWWTLGAGASALDMKSWRRPARFTKMAPENAYLFAQPGVIGNDESMKMIWVGSGEIYTLPLHRGVGLYAPANGRVEVQPSFDLSKATSSTKLWINANAKWGPKLPQGGCDETCAAYVLVELLDVHGNVIDGYDHSHFNPIMDQDEINLPLKWNNSTKLPVGNNDITVKIWFRAAKIYAVYLGEHFQPGH